MAADAELESLRQTVSELERRLQAVRSIAIGLSTATNVPDLIREALNISLKVAESDAGSILLYDHDKKKLIFQYVIGEKAGELTGMELDPGLGLAGKAFQTGESIVSQDVSQESDHLKELGEMVGYITTNIVTVPLMSPGGELFGVMQVLNKRNAPFDEHDVALIETMAAHIAVAIETARLHEEARLATIVRFVGDISHDVKNMVTPTMTGAETLGMVAEDCFAKFDECISRLKGNAQADQVCSAISELRELCPEIIEMIMEGCEAVQQRMAEISAAVKGIVSKPSFEETDLVSIGRRVGAMLKPLAQKKGLSLEIQGEVPPAMVDGKMIYNAVYNLIFNAIDACEKGDSVTFSFEGNNGDIVMECADTGPGMPENIKARLFTDDAVSTKPMGTGLGTRIVKNVIDAHGGTVSVASELGVGTTICCRIPVHRSSSGGVS